MKISVITVVYNGEDLLENTIKSVLSQKYGDFEYIIIDGLSTDRTPEIIAKYGDKISKVVSEADNGIYDAMNKAISIAEGEWINFLNTGDTFCNDGILSRVSDKLDDNSDFVYGDRYRIGTDGVNALEKAKPIEETAYREAAFHQSLFSRATILAPRFDTRYSLAADYELIVRNWVNGARFKRVDLAICNFLEGGRSREHHFKAYLEAMLIHYDHLTGKNQWKRSDFFRDFFAKNLGNFLNTKLQNFKRNHAGFDLHTEKDSQGNIIFSSNCQEQDVQQFLKQLNAPFAALHEVDPAGPKLTVITVVFNAVNDIESTINSVIEQNYPNLEYLVIDGHSTDGTSGIIEKHLDDIDVYVNERDSGIYDAMNKGITAATGQFTLFMNAGDTFCTENSLAQLAQNIDSTVSVVYGDRNYIRANGEIRLQEAKHVDTVFERMPYCHQSALASTEILREFPFNTTYKYAADYNQVVEIYSAGKIFKHVAGPVCNFSEGGKSESGLRPYLEVLKIQFDNCNDHTRIKDESVYFNAFKNNVDDLLDI